MAWRNKKKKDSTATAVVWEQTPPVAILDGDENVTTPVEEATLGKLARLCPFSPVAIGVLQLFDRETSSTQAIAAMLQSDPALAAETLAYVNSPLFALPKPVTELHNAILVLGAENTKRIAATLAMRGMLKSAPKPAITRRLWRHSLATAQIAAELAPLYGVAPELANTAGVLHDVGRAGLLAQDGEKYAHVMLQLYEDAAAILLAERQACGMDHCTAGAYLAHHWAFPAAFQEVAAKHHEATAEEGITGLVQVACAMADDMAFPAISHRGVLSLADRIAACIPAAQREKALALLEGMQQRIDAKVDELDF